MKFLFVIIILYFVLDLILYITLFVTPDFLHL